MTDKECTDFSDDATLILIPSGSSCRLVDRWIFAGISQFLEVGQESEI